MATKLYVGNLPEDTTEAALRELFAANGRHVAGVTLASDRFTGAARGFAFVEMSSPDDALAAIAALNGQAIGEHVLTVNEARPKSDRGGASRSGRDGLGAAGRGSKGPGNNR